KQLATSISTDHDTMLYCGSFDAAFVFNVRCEDVGNSKRVYRGTVRPTIDVGLAKFLQEKKIDVVLIQQADSHGATPAHILLSDKLRMAVRQAGFTVENETLDYQQSPQHLNRSISVEVWRQRVELGNRS
ncbi:MAG: hypothetical protein ABGZ35_33035, partial [Planctomycetaceae bacterium]